MSIPRPPTTTAPLGRYSTSSNRPTFEDLNPRHSFQATPPFESDMDYRRSSFGLGSRPHSYHPQIHQELPRHPVIVHGAPPPITRYVCFQKRPSGRPWKNEWETCDHITMSISPEETEKQIRKHDEPGRDIGTCISKLGKYQLRHLRKQEDKLNKSEKDIKNFKWVVSAVGKEKKQSGGASQTFWAIYSRQSRFRPTTAPAPGRPPLPGRSQTYTHHSTAPIRREEQPYDGPIVVQSVEIPAPPRPSSFIGGRPASFSGGRPATSGGYYGGDFMSPTGPPQVQDVNPVRQGFPMFSTPGPQLREVDGRSSFTHAQLLSQAADAFPRAATRMPLGVEAQGFGYQQPHSAEPRTSMPSITRTQSTRVEQSFQAEQPSKRSPRHSEGRQSRRTQQTPPQERHRRSSSMAAPRVRQTENYQDHAPPPAENRKSMNRRSTAVELPEVYPEDKMNRTDRWVESSISGSSGLGTSTVGSGDGGSVVGDYVLNPPPMGKRRNSVSTYAGKDYYQNTSGNRRSMAGDYYVDAKPALEMQMQYETTPQHQRGRLEPKYVGYHGVGAKRSASRRRSRYGGAEDGDYEYESADESMQEQMRNLRVNSSTSRRGPSRPQYRRYRGLVEYGR
jgi:hypothetical protein